MASSTSRVDVQSDNLIFAINRLEKQRDGELRTSRLLLLSSPPSSAFDARKTDLHHPAFTISNCVAQ
ncbi:unnamed protein product [Linum trigynum]|uniref:Uncharacterized protein n=1 Tax=Linum trigynum TaxID=586398 RepID=A0AAV2DBD4_9ROSI